jgi:hypothetical protein
MTPLRCAAISLLVAFAGAATAQTGHRTVAPSYATTGQAATGEIISEDGNQLRLNVTPCQADKTVVVFHKPYAKNSRGSTQCNGATKDLVQVLQQ